jgi:hypothetical protein
MHISVTNRFKRYKKSRDIVSACIQYLVQDFNFAGSDYLLKHYSFKRFLKSVDKVLHELAIRVQKDYMFLKTEYLIMGRFHQHTLHRRPEGAPSDLHREEEDPELRTIYSYLCFFL